MVNQVFLKEIVDHQRLHGYILFPSGFYHSMWVVFSTCLGLVATVRLGVFYYAPTVAYIFLRRLELEWPPSNH